MLFSLVGKEEPAYGFPSFKFQQMWTTHEQFFYSVSKAWEGEVMGSPLCRLAVKLKYLKSALQIWNKQIFGRTEANISRLELRIEEIEKNL